VSRTTPRDNSKHVILAVGTYKPKDFAAQMNVQLTNAWGIVRAIIDICRKRPDGKYVLVKVLSPLKFLFLYLILTALGPE
jgi:translation initiation factor 3 subunit D